MIIIINSLFNNSSIHYCVVLPLCIPLPLYFIQTSHLFSITKSLLVSHHFLFTLLLLIIPPLPLSTVFFFSIWKNRSSSCWTVQISLSYIYGGGWDWSYFLAFSNNCVVIVVVAFFLYPLKLFLHFLPV